ncbi:hypothetical protein RQP53_15645 [Paucibacter sp. APW11]|uniref:ABC transmembrane type-1 domain-containing protein n=1 Tax=Roseateles aquae TaxID=3077235 RepID=A0ABU3PDP0_9BURK|nr:hypothetical protein [Paucibacter sp. APW11]MDT9000709.1 hypothetical protein [Paucibacter sp. APW11]
MARMTGFGRARRARQLLQLRQLFGAEQCGQGLAGLFAHLLMGLAPVLHLALMAFMEELIDLRRLVGTEAQGLLQSLLPLRRIRRWWGFGWRWWRWWRWWRALARGRLGAVPCGRRSVAGGWMQQRDEQQGGEKMSDHGSSWA